MSALNSVWGLLALIIIAAIVFVKAGGAGTVGQSGGDQTATILKASGGAGSQLITALEGGNSQTGSGGSFYG